MKLIKNLIVLPQVLITINSIHIFSFCTASLSANFHELTLAPRANLFLDHIKGLFKMCFQELNNKNSNSLVIAVLFLHIMLILTPAY